MEENKFFKWVWRFNGVVISFAGVAAVIAFSFLGYNLYKDATRDRHARNIVSIQENSEVEEEWDFGYPSKINEGGIFSLPLQSEQKSTAGYSSKSAKSTRNILFVNTISFQERWLFEHTNYLVESDRELSLKADGSKINTIAILYQVVKSDTNKDNRLSSSDLSVIAISRPDGSEYKELIDDVDSIMAEKLLNENELFLIYQKEEGAYSAVINLESQEVKKTKVLKKLSTEK